MEGGVLGLAGLFTPRTQAMSPSLRPNLLFFFFSCGLKQECVWTGGE
jgi:hypothetical protein